MSRNNNSIVSVKPFCKVCFDAKKPESVYTSHFVRKTKDPNSEPTCPIVMATECRYCHKLGHTISRCVLREQNNARRDAQAQAQAQVQAQAQAQAPVQAPVRNTNNRFSLFEEEEEVIVESVVADYPSLGKMNTATVSQKMSYASAFVATAAPAKWQTAKEKDFEKNKEKQAIETYKINYANYAVAKEPVIASLDRAHNYDSAPNNWDDDVYASKQTTWVYKPPVYEGYEDENF